MLTAQSFVFRRVLPSYEVHGRGKRINNLLHKISERCLVKATGFKLLKNLAAVWRVSNRNGDASEEKYSCSKSRKF